MHLVLGVTGMSGAAVAEALLAKGERVRVLVRDGNKAKAWAARGVEIAEGDAHERASVVAALAGARAAYFLNPPAPAAPDPFAEAARLADTLAAASVDARLPHAVILSSIGAHGPPIGLIATTRRLEDAFRATGRPVTAVRPTYFVHSALPILSQTLASGVLPSFVRPLTRPFNQVAVADLGRVAADAMIAPPPRGLRVIELEGTSWSPHDIAAALAQVAGKPIVAVQAPRDQLEPILTAGGASAAYARATAEIIDGLNEERVGFEGGAIERARGATGLVDAIRAMLAARP